MFMTYTPGDEYTALELSQKSVKNWGMTEFILSLQFWPLLEIEPFEKGEKDLVKKLNVHYRGVSLWLQLYELKSEYLKHLILNSPAEAMKPHADRSLAMLKFCRQIYPKLERAQDFSSAEHLWCTCEYSHCLAVMHNCGFTGKVKTNSDGQIMGKSDWLDASNKLNKKYRRVLKDGLTPQEEQAKYPVSEGSLFEVLVWEATILADKESDEELERSCKDILDAIAKYNQFLAASSEFQMPYLRSFKDELRFTSKGKKNGRPEGFTSKRSRGRPPKGSSIKNRL